MADARDEKTNPDVFSAKAKWLIFMPRNRWRMADADACARCTGPCGDTMEIWIKVKNGRLTRVTFDTDGCGATLAAGSAVTLIARGLTLTQARQINQRAVLHYLDGLPEPVVHCALLAATTFQLALDQVYVEPITRPQES